jgi:hypothetical protein
MRRLNDLAARHRTYLAWAALSLACLLILIMIAVLVAQELRSAPLGLMSAALTLLLAITLATLLTSRRG